MPNIDPRKLDLQRELCALYNDEIKPGQQIAVKSTTKATYYVTRSLGKAQVLRDGRAMVCTLGRGGVDNPMVEIERVTTKERLDNGEPHIVG